MRTKKETGFWKVWVIVGALIISNVMSLDASVFAAEQKYDLKVAFAVEVPENDKAWGSINSMALDWAKNKLEKEGHKILIERNFLVPPSDLAKAAIPYAERGFDLFYVPCIGHGPELFFAAKAHPKMKFFYVAASLEGDLVPKGFAEQEIEIPKNLCVATQYGHLVACYLGGMVAGGITKSNKIGFLGGVEYPSIKEKMDWMKMGVKEINPNADLSFNSWVGNWIDVAKGKEIAEAMSQKGVDVIMTYADGIATGASNFAKQHKGLYMINSMYPTQEVFPECVVADMIENEAGVMYSLMKAILDKKWDKVGGKWITTHIVQTDYFLPYDPVLQINPKLRSLIPENVLKAIDAKTEEFKAGKVKIPLLVERENPKFKLRPIGFPGEK